MTQDRTTMSPMMRMISPDAANRDTLDHYPTPPGATRALLKRVPFEGFFWEPACAEGHMAEVLKEPNPFSGDSHEVIASDIHYYGYGRKDPVDFLSVSLEATEDYSIRQILLKTGRDGTPLNIVTNPPFKHALAFAKKALELTKPTEPGRKSGKVAMLVRLMYLESLGRKEFFENSPFSKVLVFSNRVPFQRGRLQRKSEKGGKTTPYCWCIWDHEHPVGTSPTVEWILYED